MLSVVKVPTQENRAGIEVLCWDLWETDNALCLVFGVADEGGEPLMSITCRANGLALVSIPETAPDALFLRELAIEFWDRLEDEERQAILAGDQKKAGKGLAIAGRWLHLCVKEGMILDLDDAAGTRPSLSQQARR